MQGHPQEGIEETGQRLGLLCMLSTIQNMNPFYTKRFASYVGRRCRAATIQDFAKEVFMDCHTVNELEKQYMREQLRRIGTPGPKIIGIDEVSLRKGHTFRIVVSDLVRERPTWFGGTVQSEASMDAFYKWLGPKKSKGIQIAVIFLS